MNQAPGIVICAVDFGWGSTGKLSAIIEALERGGMDCRLIVLGSALGRTVLSPVEVEAWYEEWPRDLADLRSLLDQHGVVAGLVVLDPDAAIALEAAGRPTVYVDSLPYLWTDADMVPVDVAAYCAQLCPSLPRLSWGPLRRVAHLHWVPSIIKRSTPRLRDPFVAVVNLGGLHSPSNAIGNPAYLRLVLPPTVRALARSGYTAVHICGNVELPEVRALSRDGPEIVSVGPRSHGEFLDLVAGAGLLVTSPGLTTLLEAAAAGTPTVCLPPQNLSQVFNARMFVGLTGRPATVDWPADVLDLAAVERARVGGEEAALTVINDALGTAQPDRVANELETDVVMVIAYVKGVPTEADPTDVDGAGAAAVAGILQDLVGRAVAQRVGTGVL